MRALFVAAVVLAAGCAHDQRFREPRGPLERSLLLRELDRDGEVRPLSAPGEHGASRVPQPATIDVDSIVELALDKSVLAAGQTAGGGERLAQLRQEAAELTRLAEQAAALGAAEAQVVRMLQATLAAATDAEQLAARRQFTAAKRAFGAAEEQFIAQLEELYPRTSTQFTELDRAMQGRRAYQGLRQYLQQRVAGFDAAQQRAVGELAAKATTLRMTALLATPGSEPVPIHLPGYDQIADGQWRPFDRTGLKLSPAEREQLRASWQATVQLSQTLQRLADGDATTAELLRAAAPALAARFEQFVSAAAGIADGLRDPQFAAALHTMVEQLPQLTAVLRRALGAGASAGLSRLQQQVQAIGAVIELRDRAVTLAQRWRAVRPQDLPALVDATWALVDAVQDLPLDLELPGPDALMALLQAHVDDLSTELRQTLRTDASLAAFRAAADRVLAVVGPLLQAGKELLATLPGKPGLTTPVPLPQTPDVPLEDAQNTLLDLTHTSCQPGDEVQLHASMLQAGREIDRADASFRIEALGWRARLSPAVVLLRPDQLDGAAERFGFAPTLSWLHSYQPRPDEGGAFAALARGLQPALGIHAAFLNFEPDREIEIGLGATLALWQGRLQFGAGCNLMATGDGDGRYYYFIGSDLISLLQDLGVGR